MVANTVPLPTKGIIVRQTGKYRYVYKVLRAYRNEKGQPTNDRVRIGILDSNGQLIPNSNYQKYYGTEQEQNETAVGSIKAVRSIGASFLVHKLLQRLGVEEILVEVFSRKIVDIILPIVVYMACRGNIIEYIKDWCEEFWIYSEPVTPPKASYIFQTIELPQKMSFFKKWKARHPDIKHLSYDVTSFSSYAKEISDAEWGYNRDGDKLPQINMGCYLSHEKGLPIFYTTYPGSIVDKSHMPYMMKYNDELDIHDVSFVLDRGFCSTENLQWLHSTSKHYIMGVDKYHKTTRTAIDEVRDTLTSSRNRLDDGTYSKTIPSRFYGVKSEMHVYYKASTAEQQVSDLMRVVETKGEMLCQLSKLTPKEIKLYSRFYDITAKKDGTFNYSINYDKIDEAAKNCGYFCILSNTSHSKDEILDIYRRKDVIEKGFDEIKNHIDMKRMHTHNDKTTCGKLFCAFIALIATSQMIEPLRNINNSSKKRHLCKIGLVTELEKIKIGVYSTGSRLLNPLTKFQRLIFDEFNFTEEDLKRYASCQI